MSHIIHHFKDRHSDHTPTWTWEDDGVGSYDPLYAMGLVEPNYPVPALQVDSMSDLGMRWATWVDDDAAFGKRW